MMQAGLAASPTRPLAALGLFVLASVLAVAAARWTAPAVDASPDSATLNQRLLRFEDGADGSIVVRDAQRGTVVDTVAPGSNGFLRSAVRGLVRERKRRGLDDSEPFRLSAHADGRLTLQDPATGRRIDLESFGPANAGAFVRLLPPLPPRSTAS